MKLVLNQLIAAFFVIMGLFGGVPVYAEKTLKIKLSTKGNDIAFDQTALQIPFAQKISLRFINEVAKDPPILHNAAIRKPDSYDVVMKELQSNSYDIEKMRGNKNVLAMTKALEPGKGETISFSSSALGFYPDVYFIAGHGEMLGMKGMLSVDGFVKKDLKLNPEALVKEYVQRDAAGDFLMTNEWLNSAVQCPECMGGPDQFEVIERYEIKKISQLKFTVTYDVLGTLSKTKFTPAKEQRISSFVVVKTEWGYKVQYGAFQMVLVDVVVEKYKTRLSPEVLQLLKQTRAGSAPAKTGE